MSEINLPTRSSRNRWLASGGVVLLAVALAWWLWPKGEQGTQPEGARAPGSGGSLSGPPAGRPRFRDMRGSGAVPVKLTEAVRGDYAVELKALGTVTAFNTVNVLPRVDGQLVKVLFEEGQQVKAGQVLAQIDPRPYQAALLQAEGNLQQSRAELKNAEVDLVRYQGLFAEDSIAKQTLDTQQAKVEQLRGTLKSLEGSVAEARLNLDYTEVRAPIAGRLGLRQVDVGNLVSSSSTTPLVTITQTAPIAVSFTVPEAELPQVLKRFRAGEKLAVEAWDRGERERLSVGTLASLDNQIDTATGTVKLKARFENADELLFPNQFVNVRLRVDTRRDATLVPVAAVQFGSSGTFVYVVGEDSKVKVRPVVVSASNGEHSVIGEGLAAGERLVLEGTDRLRDGSQVEVVDGAAKPAEPATRVSDKAPQGQRGPADGAPAGKPAA